MAAEGRRYQGVLYCGLMITKSGPKVLEFNVRFGDPETQATFLRLDDNFAEIARDASEGALKISHMNWRKEAVACVVLAAEGYPGSPRKGDEITGIDEAEALYRDSLESSRRVLEEGDSVTRGTEVRLAWKQHQLAEQIFLAVGRAHRPAKFRHGGVGAMGG